MKKGGTLISSNSWYNRSLPLLETEKKFFFSLDLSKTLLVCVQHLCSTTYSLFRALFELHLKPQNLFALGKCYSTDPKVFFQLKKDLVNVSASSLNFNSHLSYDLDFERSCDELLRKIIALPNLNEFEKIIILDDGGHLLERANSMMPKLSNIIGVEQTSSGYNRIKDQFIFFPIINLARSWLKLNYESLIIVRLVQRKLLEKLSNIVHYSKKMLLIGYGYLGQQTYHSLKSGFDIVVFDLDIKKTMIQISDFKKRLKEFDIIIGCTGATSLTVEDFKYLKKPVILASISSSDREFEAVKFRQMHPPLQNCHIDVTHKGITLLNAGFPITFDSDYDGIDTDDFQLTRTLLLTSICQAFLTKSENRRFLEVKEDYQKRILNNFRSIDLQ